MKQMSNMAFDVFREEFGFGEYELFLAKQQELEQKSRWICDVDNMSVIPVGDSMEAYSIFRDPKNKIPQDILVDTAENAGLILQYMGQKECLRDCAMSSLQRTVGLTGPGYSWLTKYNLAQMLSYALTGSRSNSKLLLRAGKISAVLSGSYEYMAPTVLLDICKDLEQQFGSMEFMGGSIAHNLTTAKFRFPDAAPEITNAYNKILLAAGRPATSILTPVVEMRTSDTADEAARLITYLEPDRNRYCLIPFGDGIAVKHQPPKEYVNSNRISCIEKFRQETQTLYAKAGDEIQSLIPSMLNTMIHNAGNAIIGLCKYINIPQKWGGMIEEDARTMYAQGCTFLDLYMLLTDVTGLAVQEGYSPQSMRIINLEEGISKIARNHWVWTKFDQPGTVSWT